MPWQIWVVLSMMAFGSLSHIAMVGKPREPVSPGLAAASTAVNVVLAVLLVTAV